MGLFLKQSTAITINLGPFVDSTDGNTEETGAITDDQVLVAKNGGDFASKHDTNDLVHDNGGWYHCQLDATDTGTLGILQVKCHPSGMLYVWREYMVVPANTYDSLIGGSDYIDAQIRGLDDIDLSATMKASINAEVDNALDTDIPAVPTAGSVNDVLNDLDGKLPTNNIMGSSVKTDKDDEIDAILVDTNELQTDWHDGGRLDLLIDAIKAVTDTLTLIAIADAVHDEVIDANNPANANSLREVINVMSAALAGKSSGGGTNTIKFRDLGDTKDRITATVDASGNRTAITDDGT